MQSQSTDTPSFATNPKEALQHFNELGFHIEYGVFIVKSLCGSSISVFVV